MSSIVIFNGARLDQVAGVPGAKDTTRVARPTPWRLAVGKIAAYLQSFDDDLNTDFAEHDHVPA